MPNCAAMTTRGKPCTRRVRDGETLCHMHIKTAGAVKPAEVLRDAVALVSSVVTRDEGRRLLSQLIRGEVRETRTTSTGEVYEADTPIKARIEAATLLARIDGWVDGADDSEAAKPKIGIYRPG